MLLCKTSVQYFWANNMSSIVYKCCIIALGVTPRGSLESIQGHSFKFSIMHCAEIAKLVFREVNREDVDVGSLLR